MLRSHLPSCCRLLVVVSHPWEYFFCYIFFEFAKHFHESRNINDNLNVIILKNNIKIAAAGKYEDKRIYRLKALTLYGLNTEIDDYVKCTI